MGGLFSVLRNAIPPLLFFRPESKNDRSLDLPALLWFSHIQFMTQDSYKFISYSSFNFILIN